ncbi:aspartate aminotransferase cytoplasmic [Penicillium argentinense]|uniref:Aspartate aminotransferase cytoplasmic n=1 Tax=Penicillium argentinense TaxID=1131581 RepID=A0A9W9EIL7_9EURO|nr:aspartate aminotransferase cytoplasmic [Penicillium argentinense]KAJ5082447.1 aspartate aminotransferase cytoplasmic [Penicillium argentinense]
MTEYREDNQERKLDSGIGAYRDERPRIFYTKTAISTTNTCLFVAMIYFSAPLRNSFQAKIAQQYAKKESVTSSFDACVYFPFQFRIDSAGFSVQEYPYYSATTKSLNIDAIISVLKGAPAGSVVMLQVRVHNPTEIDPSQEEWKRIAEVMQVCGHLASFDCATRDSPPVISIEILEPDSSAASRNLLRRISAAKVNALVPFTLSVPFGVDSSHLSTRISMRNFCRVAAGSSRHEESFVKYSTPNSVATEGSWNAWPLGVFVYSDRHVQLHWDVEAANSKAEGKVAHLLDRSLSFLSSKTFGLLIDDNCRQKTGACRRQVSTHTATNTSFMLSMMLFAPLPNPSPLISFLQTK